MQGLRREAVLPYLVGAAVIATPISITAFEILMGLALVELIITHKQWRLPPFWPPLALFAIGTLVSLAASGQIREGLPQVRKFYIYLMLFLVTSAFHNVGQIRALFLGWSFAAAVSATWGLLQFGRKYASARNAGQPFYSFYVADRITGFTDHWMTLGGQMMIAFLVITAVILYAGDRRGLRWLLAAAVLIAAALVETWTRSMWLGALCGGVYLIWFWRPRALFAAPVVIVALLYLNPFALRDRVLSVFSPHGSMDSNAHRAELRAIGWRMIKANPWLGVGPEQVSRQIETYLPPGMLTRRPGEYYGHLENNCIQYAAERGIPTMLALMWMIVWAVRDFGRALRRLPAGAEERWVIHAAIAVTIGVLVGGWYSWNLNTSYVLAMFLAVIGSGYGASVSESRCVTGGPVP